MGKDDEFEQPDTVDDEERATEPGSPGTVGAVDGAAAAGSSGAVTDEEDDDSVLPQGGPDPSVGPD